METLEISVIPGRRVGQGVWPAELAPAEVSVGLAWTLGHDGAAKERAMLTQWIAQCTVHRMSLRGGLVLDMADDSELVISRPMRLTLPPAGRYPEEEVWIDPTNVSDVERPLLDLAGAVCIDAWCDDDGRLHLSFSRGHRIDVDPDEKTTSWELYGKNHGYMACLPHGRIRVVRHDLPEDQDEDAAAAT